MDPIILFFLLGVLAGALRSELRLPGQIYDFLSILLLMSIGLKGGVELSRQPFAPLLPQILTIIALGLSLPVIAYPVLRRLGRFGRTDAASIAAHYGSVSVGTFAVAIAYLGSRDIFYEPQMPLFVVLLEMPAILIGIILAKGFGGNTQWGRVAHEVFLGKGIVLLAGGLIIGWIAGEDGVGAIGPLFFDLFKGVLSLFLLEMGLIVAKQLSSLRTYGLFLLIFGVVMPLFSSVVGAVLGVLLGLSVGGTAILATLSASASYIAVPAAMRISLPRANPTLSLGASLGITFPFNVLVGVPLYLELARHMHVWIGG